MLCGTSFVFWISALTMSMLVSARHDFETSSGLELVRGLSSRALGLLVMGVRGLLAFEPDSSVRGLVRVLVVVGWSAAKLGFGASS